MSKIQKYLISLRGNKESATPFLHHFLLLLPLLIFLAGCSTFNERFYVVSTDGDMRNYYRTKIGGWTFLSVSEFQAGSAPTEIVDSLLGQAQSTLFAPRETELAKTALEAARSRAEEKRKEQGAKLIDPFTGREMPDQKIVISLSSNPDAIFQALQGAATSAEVSKAVESIVLGQRAATLVTLRSDAQRQRLDIQKLVEQLKNEQAAIQNADQNALIMLLQRLVAGVD